MKILVTGFSGSAVTLHILAHTDGISDIDYCNDPALKEARAERIKK